MITRESNKDQEKNRAAYEPYKIKRFGKIFFTLEELTPR